MNERIRELAECARCWAKVKLQDTNIGYSSRLYENLYNEKFAELIVGECVRVCEGLADNAWSVGEVRHAEQCAEAIKQHFGVDK